jgi:proliferating cell nuclear antigen PCNA
MKGSVIPVEDVQTTPKRKTRQRKPKNDATVSTGQETVSQSSNTILLEKKSENVLTAEESAVKCEPNPDYLLELRMDNGITFKGIVESLKNVIPEANFVFSEKGLRMMAFEYQPQIDPPMVKAASFLTMAAEYFDIFHCSKEQIVGLDIPHFYKLIKPLKMNDSLTFIIHKEHRDQLRIVIANTEKKTRVEHHMHSKHLPDQIYEFDSKLEFGFDYAPPVIDSANLQVVCRSLHSIDAYNISISYVNDVLRFEGHGDETSSFYEFQVGPAFGEEYDPKEGKVPVAGAGVEVRGEFPLEQLHNFTKAAHHLSTKVVVAISHENYVLVEYSLDPRNLNTLRYLLSHAPSHS